MTVELFHTPLSEANIHQINMLKGQLATNGITDEHVKSALLSVDRAQFVPESLQHVAYVDDDIPLCRNRYLLEPLIFAKMLVYAGIRPEHTVLDVGAGMGYSAAVIAKLAKHVVATEESAELVAIARKKLAIAAVKNVDIVTAPLTAGCTAHQPYNIILVEGVLHKIPEKYELQLAENGKIVAIKAASPVFATKQMLGNIIVGTKYKGYVSYVEYEEYFAYPLYESIANDDFTF
jgi:protein-L-isoaspartate(D-aspartate) O-methyltransferase